MPYNLRGVQFFSFILLYSLIFQAIGVFPGTDTQPNFIILSTIFMLLCVNSLKYEYINVIAFVVCYMFLLFAFLLQAEHIELKYFLTYTTSLLSFFIIFILVKNQVLVLTSKFLITVTVIYAFVGAVQFIIPDFLSFLVTRSVDAAFSFAESGRGSRSLTGEPAHLGKIFIILNVLYLFCMCMEDKIKVHPNKLIFITILFLLVNLFISRSFYAIFIHFLILFILIFVVNRPVFICLSVIFLILSGFFISLINNVDSNIRFANILSVLINNPSELLNQGAMRRVFNIPLSINNLRAFEWYGAGSDPRKFVGSLPTPLGILHYTVANRAYGGMIEFALKFGLLSIPLFITYFILLFRISIIRTTFEGKGINIGLFFVVCIFILTFQEGALAKPLPMFLLIYIYIHRGVLQD
jgi:hypothetical protein